MLFHGLLRTPDGGRWCQYSAAEKEAVDFFFAAEDDGFVVANFPGFIISDGDRGGGGGGWEMNEETAEED